MHKKEDEMKVDFSTCREFLEPRLRNHVKRTTNNDKEKLKNEKA